MGFGDLLKMKITKVPGALSRYVVDKFDSTKMKIVLREGVEIDVTRESVNQMLGFPLEKKQLHEIKMNIVASDNADMNFQMNFIALLINSLIESSSCGKANTYPLNYVMKNTNIRNIDWCSYLLNCLVKTKRSVDSSNPTSNFVGPSAFLVLLYVDRVHYSVVIAERKRPVICHWTSEKMKLREIYEKEILTQFGIGDLNEDFVEEDINQEDYQQMILMKIRKIYLLIEN
uniref:Ubiquitin-like protease family profile domain-containing protein n=1 Tax=Lactuca sativa TaxID=4236 RepID=A0A9R1WFZ2_LACSA|nr:hypothetical protein LSAT_V11C200084180 [Lactuca sativa]